MQATIQRLPPEISLREVQLNQTRLTEILNTRGDTLATLYSYQMPEWLAKNCYCRVGNTNLYHRVPRPARAC